VLIVKSAVLSVIVGLDPPPLAVAGTQLVPFQDKT